MAGTRQDYTSVPTAGDVLGGWDICREHSHLMHGPELRLSLKWSLPCSWWGLWCEESQTSPGDLQPDRAQEGLAPAISTNKEQTGCWQLLHAHRTGLGSPSQTHAAPWALVRRGVLAAGLPGGSVTLAHQGRGWRRRVPPPRAAPATTPALAPIPGQAVPPCGNLLPEMGGAPGLPAKAHGAACPC